MTDPPKDVDVERARAAWRKGCAEGQIMPVLVALWEAADALQARAAQLAEAQGSLSALRGLVDSLHAERREDRAQLAEREREKMAALVAYYHVAPADCATFCDEVMDRSGALLGRIRAAATHSDSEESG